MTERPDAPPEGELIKVALAASGLSQREASRRAGMSDTRWRQIVSGYQSVDGTPVPVRGRDETLARMAHVVGVRPEQFEDVGRPDAAEELRDLTARKRDIDAASAIPSGAYDRLEERWHLVEAVLRTAREGLSPSEDSSLVGRVHGLLAQDPDGFTPKAPG
ncbi:helix-turn-helix domain-containing protein [Streptomyces sp. NPDC088197]|uniref:helix-turn-helix domain-containing protein n=1 Tax=unclassified Streptomyces TaxID=2593676 RepID=UPI0033BAC431